MRKARATVLVVSVAGAICVAGGASAWSPPPCLPPLSVSTCREAGYYETSCGIANKDKCYSLEHDASTEPVTKVNQPELLLKGSGWATTAGEAKPGKHTTDFDKGAIELSATAGATFEDASMLAVPYPVVAPESYIKNPAYEADGNSISTCKEYVYKRYYDYNRFEDSARVCRTDDCVYDVAYYTPPLPATYGPPAIADRTLLRKDGVAIPKQIDMAFDDRQKNLFFEIPTAWLKKGSKYTSDPVKFNAIFKHIADHQLHYKFDATGADPTKFDSGWAWHQAMHAAAPALTAAERNVIDRRLTKLRKLLDEATTYIIKASAGADKVPILDDLSKVLPGYGPGPDPFVLPSSAIDPFTYMASFDAFRTSVAQGTFQVKADWLKWVLLQPSAQEKQSGQISTPIPTLTPLSGNGPFPDGFAEDAPFFAAVTLPVVGLSVVTDTWTGWQNELLVMLEQEWDKGAAGCLALGSNACDWSPRMFSDSVLGLYQDERERDYARCMQATGDVFSSTPFAGIDETEAYITTQLKKFGDALKGLPKIPAGPDAEYAALGDRKQGGKTLGVPGLFGAVYDYDMGWKVEVTEKTPAPANQICKVGASAWGDLNATVWYPTDDPPYVKTVKIIETHNRASLDKTGAAFHSDLKIAELNIYSPKPAIDEALSAPSVKAGSEGGTISLTKMTKTVIILGVPVTLSTWGQLDYGYAWSMKVEAAGACLPSNVTLGVAAHLEPMAKADGFASVAIGIPGLGIGVDGALNLFDAKAPVDAAAKTSTVGSELFLEIDHRAEIDLRELRGRLAAYAELCVSIFCKRAEKEIFAWDGLHQNIPLWNHTNKFPVLAFNLLATP